MSTRTTQQKVRRGEVIVSRCPKKLTSRQHWRADGTCKCQPSLDHVQPGAQLGAYRKPLLDSDEQLITATTPGQMTFDEVS